MRVGTRAAAVCTRNENEGQDSRKTTEVKTSGLWLIEHGEKVVKNEPETFHLRAWVDGNPEIKSKARRRSSLRGAEFTWGCRFVTAQQTSRDGRGVWPRSRSLGEMFGSRQSRRGD